MVLGTPTCTETWEVHKGPLGKIGTYPEATTAYYRDLDEPTTIIS